MNIEKMKVLRLFCVPLFYLLLTFSSLLVIAQSSDEDYPDLKEDSVQEEFFTQKKDWFHPLQDQRKLPEQEKKSLKKNKSFWYADYDFRNDGDIKVEGRDNTYVPLLQRTWFQTLIWLVIIGCFVAAIIWFLAGSQVNIFRKKDTKSTGGENQETMPEDIFSIHYQQEIDQAMKAGNFRLAIRLMFLEMLKKMAERNLIHFKQDKTNLDYLMQLQPTVFYKSFFRITRNYEYSWYGEFNISREVFDRVRDDFKQLERQIG